MGTAVFVPKEATPGAIVAIERVCAGCQVREECLAFAMADPDTDGW
jgi:hypothetical protein